MSHRWSVPRDKNTACRSLYWRDHGTRILRNALAYHNTHVTRCGCIACLEGKLRLEAFVPDQNTWNCVRLPYVQQKIQEIGLTCRSFSTDHGEQLDATDLDLPQELVSLVSDTLTGFAVIKPIIKLILKYRGIPQASQIFNREIHLSTSDVHISLGQHEDWVEFSLGYRLWRLERPWKSPEAAKLEKLITWLKEVVE
jgi:hypothetical protein